MTLDHKGNKIKITPTNDNISKPFTPIQSELMIPWQDWKPSLDSLLSCQ